MSPKAGNDEGRGNPFQNEFFGYPTFLKGFWGIPHFCDSFGALANSYAGFLRAGPWSPIARGSFHGHELRAVARVHALGAGEQRNDEWPDISSVCLGSQGKFSVGETVTAPPPANVASGPAPKWLPSPWHPKNATCERDQGTVKDVTGV